jgi:HK97 gp10 family phage protein
VDVEVKITGLQELEARLQEMGALAGSKLLGRVLRKIAKPMLQAAKMGALSIRHSGALAASVKAYNKRPKGGEVARVAVGSRAKDRTALWLHNTAYQRQRKGIYYGWMVEKGHGNAQARPWFGPAVQANEARAVSAFVSELQKAIDRSTRRKSKIAQPDSLVTE